MHYLKRRVPSPLGDNAIYQEFDGDSEMRRVVAYGDQWFGSRDPESGGHVLVTEGADTEIEPVTIEIDAAEFEEAWTRSGDPST